MIISQQAVDPSSPRSSPSENKHGIRTRAVFGRLTITLTLCFIGGQVLADGYGDPKYGGKPYKQPQQQSQPSQQQQKAESQEAAATQYLQNVAAGTKLVATKCPDGEGKYYATGTRPKIKPEVVGCVDVRFRAYCAGSAQYSEGIARNFIGMSGCFGDTYDIDPKPNCKIDQVRIDVVEAMPGCHR